MASPITWQSIKAPSFEESNELFASGADTLSRSLAGLSKQATAQGTKVTDRNTEALLGQIQGIGNIDQYNEAQASGIFGTEALRGQYGDYVDVGKINAAFGSRDDTIKKEALADYEYQTKIQEQAQKPFLDEYSLAIANAPDTESKAALLTQLQGDTRISDINKSALIGSLEAEGTKDTTAARAAAELAQTDLDKQLTKRALASATANGDTADIMRSVLVGMSQAGASSEAIDKATTALQNRITALSGLTDSQKSAVAEFDTKLNTAEQFGIAALNNERQKVYTETNYSKEIYDTYANKDLSVVEATKGVSSVISPDGGNEAQVAIKEANRIYKEVTGEPLNGAGIEYIFTTLGKNAGWFTPGKLNDEGVRLAAKAYADSVKSSRDNHGVVNERLRSIQEQEDKLKAKKTALSEERLRTVKRGNRTGKPQEFTGSVDDLIFDLDKYLDSRKTKEKDTPKVEADKDATLSVPESTQAKSTEASRKKLIESLSTGTDLNKKLTKDDFIEYFFPYKQKRGESKSDYERRTGNITTY